LRNELLQADKAFSLLSLDQGVEKAYLRYLDDTAVQLPDGGMPLKGKLAIMANVKASVGDMEFSLSWEPVDVQVSLSGDLGYTWGYYYLEATGEDGELYAAEGKYASVWRHRAEQGWQVVLDTSNQNEPPYLDELEFDLPVE
jgi:ketosteroid isomerase-like protein